MLPPACAPALVALAATLLGSPAGEPPRAGRPERAAPPAAPRRSWRFPTGVGVAHAAPAGSIASDLTLAGAFGDGMATRVDAGLAYRAVGASVVWRRGFVGAGNRWCPSGSSCTARFGSMGGALRFSPVPDEAFSPVLMLGAAMAEGEVRWRGSFRRVTGQELFLSLFMGPRFGGPSSPWRIGGYFDLRVLRLDHFETPDGTTKIPAARRGTPIWFELGLRAGFE